jgi:NAD dependent epimerase/dehydratase family enzyme
MKLLFGELSELLLNGNFVSGEKLKASGFHYQYSTIEDALESIYLS